MKHHETLASRRKFTAVCPDNTQRRCAVSFREWRSYGYRLARDGRSALGPRGRVQANGLSVYGRLWLGLSGLWHFEPSHGGSPAFLPREGRRMAALILVKCSQRLMMDGAPRSVAAALAALPRVKRLAGKRPVDWSPRSMVARGYHGPASAAQRAVPMPGYRRISWDEAYELSQPDNAWIGEFARNQRPFVTFGPVAP